MTRHELPVTTPARTFADLASMLSLDELVVAADYLLFDPRRPVLSDPRPFARRQELAEAVALTHRGRLTARRALSFARVGAESRTESLLRLLLTRAGLPEPELNPDILDGAGRFIGRADLCWPDRRVIVEYDGEQHRLDDFQYAKDVERIERFQAEGWRHIRVLKRGLFSTPASTVARVRSALE